MLRRLSQQIQTQMSAALVYKPASLHHAMLILILGLFVIGNPTTQHIDAKGSGNVQLFLPLLHANSAIVQTTQLGSWGSPITINPIDQTIWSVNPDAGSVSVVDSATWAKKGEILVGGEPWSIAMAPDGKNVYILDRAQGRFVVIHTDDFRIHASIPIGPEPGSIALSPSGRFAYITITSADQVIIIDTVDFRILQRIMVDPRPYAIAVTNNGDHHDQDQQIIVTHLLALPNASGHAVSDHGYTAYVSLIHASSGVIQQIPLAADIHGFPNILAGIALYGDRAWVPHIRDAPALPNDLTSTVFAAVDSINIRAGTENIDERLLLNDEVIFGSPVNNPIAAIPAPDGKRIYIVLAGSDLVEVVDIAAPDHPQLLTFLAVGKNPRGMVISADGHTGYVMNYLSRSITRLDLQTLKPTAELVVTHETLSPIVLRGKILFNNASDPRLSQKSWISCASCHSDGGSDGVTWVFPDGPRQTPALWNAGQTLPWHWSAALDEPQDVEQTIQQIQKGIGLAPGSDPTPLGSPNAGRSADLDALTAYLKQGFRAPAIAQPAEDLTQGRALFITHNCVVCHGGSAWTSSSLIGQPSTLDPDQNGMVDSSLRDVGTVTNADQRGATGFDPPSLLDIGLTAPYMHNGSLISLEAVLTSGHPDPHMTPAFTSAELKTLVAFLRSIGPTTPSITHQ